MRQDDKQMVKKLCERITIEIQKSENETHDSQILTAICHLEYALACVRWDKEDEFDKKFNSGRM